MVEEDTSVIRPWSARSCKIDRGATAPQGKSARIENRALKMQPNTLPTGPVSWAWWNPAQGAFTAYSAGFPSGWLAQPPGWLPPVVGFPEPVPEKPVWFIRPVGKYSVLGILYFTGEKQPFWRILIPSLRQFLATGAYAPAWVWAVLKAPVEDVSRQGSDQLSLEVLPPVTSAADLGAHLAKYDSAELLGGAQALVDQAKAVLVSDVPVTFPFEGVLPLVPHSRRGELALASWWPVDSPTWDLRVGPSESMPASTTVWRWNNIADYPVGKYEYSLHEAVSLGNEQTVADLLGRPSRDRMLRLGLALIVLLMVVQLLAAVFGWRPGALRGPVNEPPPVLEKKPNGATP